MNLSKETVYWKPCDANTPQGITLQLINKTSRRMAYGVYYRGDDWTHWQLVPIFGERMADQCISPKPYFQVE